MAGASYATKHDASYATNASYAVPGSTAKAGAHAPQEGSQYLRACSLCGESAYLRNGCCLNPTCRLSLWEQNPEDASKRLFRWGKSDHDPKLGEKIQAVQKRRGTKGLKHRQWWKDQPEWKKQKLLGKTKKDAFDKKNKMKTGKKADGAEEEDDDEEEEDGDGVIPAWWRRYDPGGPDGGSGGGDGTGSGGGDGTGSAGAADRVHVVGSTPVAAS